MGFGVNFIVKLQNVAMMISNKTLPVNGDSEAFDSIL